MVKVISSSSDGADSDQPMSNLGVPRHLRNNSDLKWQMSDEKIGTKSKDVLCEVRIDNISE